jgi:hypothetical protein
MGETEEEAKAKYARNVAQQRFVDRRLALISGITDIDFSQFLMDKPLPEDLCARWRVRVRRVQGAGRTSNSICRQTSPICPRCCVPRFTASSRKR